MHATWVQDSRGPNLTLQGSIWGGIMAFGLLVAVITSAAAGATAGIGWQIAFMLLGGLGLGLGLGLPGIGKGISLLAVGLVSIVLLLIMALANTPFSRRAIPVGAIAAGSTIWFLSNLFMVVYGGGLVSRRAYPDRLPGRVLTIVGASFLVLVCLLAIITLLVGLTQSRGMMDVLLGIVFLLLSLWMLAVMIMSIVNGAIRGGSDALTTLTHIGVRIGVATLLGFMGVMCAWMAIEMGSIVPLASFPGFVGILSPIFIGSFGLGAMVCGLLVMSGSAAQVAPTAASGVAAPVRQQAEAPAIRTVTCGACGQQATVDPSQGDAFTCPHCQGAITLQAAQPQRITCPGCQTTYKLRPELAGRRLKCRKCGGLIEPPADDRAGRTP